MTTAATKPARPMYITLAEAARLLGISVSAVKRSASSTGVVAGVPVVRVGGIRKVSVRALHAKASQVAS